MKNPCQTTLLLTILSLAAYDTLGQGTLTPAGAPAPTMKTLDQIESRTPVDAAHTPGDSGSLFVISQPGSYYLMGNITGVINKTGIRIAADNVTLDLAGYGVNGNSSGTFGIAAPGRLSVAVHNGSVYGWTFDGVYLSGCKNAVVEDLRVSSNTKNGIQAGENSLVKKCVVFGNTAGSTAASPSFGILCGAGATIIDCSVQANNGTNSFGIAPGSASTIINCTANQNDGNNGGGISASTGSSVINCTASLNVGAGSIGINISSDSVARNCNASYNQGTGGMGIVAGSRCTVSDCRTSSNGGDGLKAADACVISSNASSGNTGAGIHTTGINNRIESNHATSNQGGGIKVDSTGSLIVRNSVRFNNGGHFVIAAGNSDAQILGGGTAFSSTNAWANFSY
jgi:hypothetical protein